MTSNVATFADEAVAVFQGFDHLFTENDEAVRELQRRQKDPWLKSDIHTYLGSSTSELLSKVAVPTALFYRQLGTPTHETMLFLETVERLSLAPLILEYLDDKFVGAGNPYKRALGKLPIYRHTGSDGRDMVQYATMIDFNKFVGKKLSEACCVHGMTLAEFHHVLLKKVTGRDPEELCFDATQWFLDHGQTAVNYYEPFMALLVRDCILFENYEVSKHLQPFMYNVVIPAFERIETRFGLRPLIVRLLPKHEEERLYWNSYPKEVEPLLGQE